MNKEEIIRKAEEYIAGAKYVDGMYVDCVEVSFFEGVLELIKNYEESPIFAAYEGQQKFIEEVNKNASHIEKAKEIINDYCRREFEDDEGADFSNLSKVGIAYTTTEDEKHEIQVNVNFVKRRIETFVDKKMIRAEQYSSLEDLVYNGLEGLDFDTLVSLEDNELEALCPNTSNRTDFTKMFLNVENLIPVEKE